MLYKFLYELKFFWFGFNVFKYVTLRAALAGATSFLLCLIICHNFIPFLKRFNIKATVRDAKEVGKLYDIHKDKQNIPTMGGIFILASILISEIFWIDLTNKYVLLTTIGMLFLGVLGFYDDFMKLRYQNAKGAAAKTKLMGQILLGLAIGSYLYFVCDFSTVLEVPFLKEILFPLGLFFIVFVTLVIVASSNAVNLTDGLDGLAIGCIGFVAVTYGILSYLTGHIDFAHYLNISFVPGVSELTVFCAAVFGASLGFLWYNCYPASVFMGDTGALSLGGTVGIIAVLVKKELLLIVVGAIFVIEALSVLIQVAFFKWKKRRIFLMSPIHHHFQITGWPESKITVRFWIVAIILSLLTLATLKLR